MKLVCLVIPMLVVLPMSLLDGADLSEEIERAVDWRYASLDADRRAVLSGFWGEVWERLPDDYPFERFEGGLYATLTLWSDLATADVASLERDFSEALVAKFTEDFESFPGEEEADALERELRMVRREVIETIEAHLDSQDVLVVTESGASNVLPRMLEEAATVATIDQSGYFDREVRGRIESMVLDRLIRARLDASIMVREAMDMHKLHAATHAPNNYRFLVTKSPLPAAIEVKKRAIAVRGDLAACPIVIDARLELDDLYGAIWDRLVKDGADQGARFDAYRSAVQGLAVEGADGVAFILDRSRFRDVTSFEPERDR